MNARSRGRVGGEVVEPEGLRGRAMELPVELVLEGLLAGKVLLLETDSAYQARLVRRKLERLMRKKNISGELVQVLVEAGGGWRYAVMLRETLESLLAEEEEAPSEAAVA